MHGGDRARITALHPDALAETGESGRDSVARALSQGGDVVEAEAARRDRREDADTRAGTAEPLRAFGARLFRPGDRERKDRYARFDGETERSISEREEIMRLLFGIVLGVALTVGVAFAHDRWFIAAPAVEAPAATDRAMVNWDVVGDNLRRVSQRAREAWTTLSQKVAS